MYAENLMCSVCSRLRLEFLTSSLSLYFLFWCSGIMIGVCAAVSLRSFTYINVINSYIK